MRQYRAYVARYDRRCTTTGAIVCTGNAFLGPEGPAMLTRVAVREPFRLDLTANVLRRLSTNVVDRFDGTTYRRLIGAADAPALLSVAQIGPNELAVSVEGAKKGYDPALPIERLLGTSVDLQPFYRAAAGVDWLAPLVAGAYGVKPPRYPSLWEACVNAIVYQQVSIHAAGAILRRVIEHLALPVVIGADGLYAFPGAQTLLDADPEGLRRMGLSINKITSLRAVARAILDGGIDEAGLSELETPELMAALTEHRGIGRGRRPSLRCADSAGWIFSRRTTRAWPRACAISRAGPTSMSRGFWRSSATSAACCITICCSAGWRRVARWNSPPHRAVPSPHDVLDSVHALEHNPARSSEHERLRGVPQDGGHLGALAIMLGMRPRRLLRRFEEQARNETFSCDAAPNHPVQRTG